MSIWGNPVMMGGSGGGGGGDDPFALTEYIESSGTQFIDTGYIPSANSRFEVIANVSQNNSVWAVILGARDGNANACWLGGKYQSNNRIIYNWGIADVDYNDGGIHVGKKTRYRMYSQGLDIYPNDRFTSVGVPYTGGTITSTNSIYLFTLNIGSGDFGSDTRCNMKLYRFRVFEGDTLLHEFVPWQENGVACLKDTVTGNIKYNAGTGSFVYGVDA